MTRTSRGQFIHKTQWISSCSNTPFSRQKHSSKSTFPHLFEVHLLLHLCYLHFVNLKQFHFLQIQVFFCLLHCSQLTELILCLCLSLIGIESSDKCFRTVWTFQFVFIIFFMSLFLFLRFQFFTTFIFLYSSFLLRVRFNVTHLQFFHYLFISLALTSYYEGS